MSTPGVPEELADSAASTLVRLMWPRFSGATWTAAEQWFARMWSAGDPADEEEVRRQLQAGTEALARRVSGEDGDRRAVDPGELAGHWSRIIAAALAERRFSAEALSGFLDEFRVPGEIGDELMRVELEIEQHTRRIDERKQRNFELWEGLRLAGLETTRRHSSEVGDRLAQAQEANNAAIARRSAAERAYGQARSELRSAEHRLTVLEKQFGEGRRTPEEVEQARGHKRDVEERVRQTEAELERVRKENAAEQQRRREAPTVLDDHRRNRSEVERLSAEVEREITAATERVEALERQSRELRRALQRQDDFYTQKTQVRRQREIDERRQEVLRRQQERQRQEAARAEWARSEALRDPTRPARAAPHSPEVEQWLRSLRSQPGQPQPAVRPAPAPPVPDVPPVPENPVNQQETRDRMQANIAYNAQAFDDLSSAADRLARAARALEQASQEFRAVRHSGDTAETAAAAERLQRAREAFVTAQEQSDAAAARLEKAKNALIDDAMQDIERMARDMRDFSRGPLTPPEPPEEDDPEATLRFRPEWADPDRDEDAPGQ